MLEFLAGAIGGICGVVVGYPFDTLKTLCQSAQSHQRLWTLMKNVKSVNNGRGLFVGMSVPVASYIAIGTTTFGTFNFMNNRLEKGSTESSTSNSAAAVNLNTLIASASAGFVQLIPSAPIENIKIRLQCTATHATTARISEVTRLIYQQEGIRGFYRGVLAHALRDVPGFIVYFTVFQYTSNFITDHQLSFANNNNNNNTLLTSGIAGSLGGVASWIATYPFDIIKTRLQANKDKNLSATLRFMRQAGVSVLFRGLTITLLRSVIVDGTMFAMNDKATHFLKLLK